jgi:hypothetical protein
MALVRYGLFVCLFAAKAVAGKGVQHAASPSARQSV